MIDKDFNTLVNKYAILLFVGYLLTFLFNSVLPRLLAEEVFSNLFLISGMITLITNIVALILVYRDFKRYNLKNNLIIVITLFFSLVGVTMFFITLNNEIKKTYTC
ncbi:MAG: hypothetical protein LBQ22_03150 [Bacteroidales bacterium]|jgi:drug/metabolite transporter (DMT)-like permease|nr:hypothetical protein [Bacteroidales bacterium]